MSTFDNTFGLLYNALVISAAIYGAGIVQGWFYYHKYRHRDPMAIRLLVALVLLCNTCQHTLVAHSIYGYLLTGHLDPDAFARVIKTFPIALLVSAFTAILVRNFYAYRAYGLSNRNWMLGGSMLCLNLGAFVSSIFYISKLVMFKDLAGWSTVRNIAVGVGILRIFSVGYICGVMNSLLRSQRSNKKPTNFPNRVIILTFATDFPTFVGSIAYLISLLASPQTFLSSFWILILSTVEVNSLLVTLNARDYIHWTRQNESIEMHSGVRFPSGSGSGSSGDRRATLPPPDNRITIRIDKQTTIDLEEGNGYSPGNSDSKPKI